MKKTNRIQRCLGILALALAVGLPSGFAELIDGTIISLNEKAKTLSLQQMDPTTGQARELKITVPEDVEFQGVDSLKDLKTGDRVRVEASQGEKPDALKADAIELIQ